MRVSSFAPVLGDKPLVLILGSVPSVISLRNGRYYDNERNHFWRLVCAVLQEPEMSDYEERLAMLRRRMIALWDSVNSCVRPGSLDKNIKEEIPNDIPGLLRDNATIRAVCFNGTAAQKMYWKYHRNDERTGGIEYLLLPSSSPIPRRLVKTFEDKLEKWKALRRFLT